MHGATNRGPSLREAQDALDIQIGRLREWQRRYGEHERGNLSREAIDSLEQLHRVMARTGEETRPLFGATERETATPVPAPTHGPAARRETRFEPPLLSIGQGTSRRDYGGTPDGSIVRVGASA